MEEEWIKILHRELNEWKSEGMPINYWDLVKEILELRKDRDK